MNDQEILEAIQNGKTVSDGSVYAFMNDGEIKFVDGYGNEYTVDAVNTIWWSTKPYICQEEIQMQSPDLQGNYSTCVVDIT